MVVDDSVVVRRLITDALGDDPDIEVVGTASNGRLALGKLDQLKPDLVTLDIEMPEMDGLTTLREIRKTHPKLPIIMFSTLTAAGATATFDALSAGASDYVTKPANVGSVTESLRSVREQLIPRIRALVGHRVSLTAAKPAAPVSRLATGPPPARTSPIRVIALGCSTGGPDALTRVVGMLPGDLRVPIVVVQHMPPVFTRLFAERLDKASQLRVVEATDGMQLVGGTIYVAPGDRHLEVAKRGPQAVTLLHEGPPENFCRPAVDVLFRSVARMYGGATLAVVLTGMGHDGREGCRELRAAGAEIVVQDEATSVVWGMPGAVATAGLAHSILPLSAIGPHVVSSAVADRLGRGTAVTAWR
ncbi:MAG: chemotaxis response regulator protein-glutamate methylesterase [Actinobacteria bacterium]|nr:chemotaxis response regulator protein-glutamate methylesterase [Actinomycetota bacterium]